MVVCLTSARFNMRADILRQGVPVDNLDAPEKEGTWKTEQDPDSGEFIRVWVANTQDNPDTPEDERPTLESFDCIARAIIDGGIRVAGTTERFGEMYEGVDYIRIFFPINVKISRRDRITNVRDKTGNIIWREEERPDRAPTVFSVNGVSPIVDPFGRAIENVALLERVEDQ